MTFEYSYSVPKPIHKSLLHYLAPFLWVLAALSSQYSGLDINIAQLFYDPVQHSWPYKSLWLTQNVLHDGARNVLVLIYISIVLLFIVSQFTGRLRLYRRTIGYILLSSLTGSF